MTDICISLRVIVALVQIAGSAFAEETLDQQHLPSKNSGSLPCLKRHVKAKAVNAVVLDTAKCMRTKRRFTFRSKSQRQKSLHLVGCERILRLRGGVAPVAADLQ